MRILVCGGRDYDHRTNVYLQLDLLKDRHGEITVIQGGSTGADRLAGEWAISRGAGLQIYNANWDLFGKAAGPIRNQRMIDEGKPDQFLAFPGGKGTTDMVKRLQNAGIPGTILKD